MIFALDIGGTYTKYAHIENGEIARKGKWETVDDFRYLLENIDRVMCEAPTKIGISCVGFWREDGSAVGCSTLTSVTENPFAEALRSRYNCPVHIENDARCALLSESEYGVLKDRENAVLFVLGSSLGCGVKLNGKLLSGTTGQAGAMFFMPERCVDNEYVFDTAANSIKLTKAYDAALTRGNMRLLSERKASGDEKAAALLENYAKAVALKCWYAYLAYDPACIAFGGGIANDAEIFEDIQTQLDAFFKMDLSGRVPTLLRTKFGEDSNLLGAALL